jgi:hypothetical protein
MALSAFFCPLIIAGDIRAGTRGALGSLREELRMMMRSHRLGAARRVAMFLVLSACQVDTSEPTVGGRATEASIAPAAPSAQPLPESAVFDFGDESDQPILADGFSLPEQVGSRQASWSEGSRSALTFSVQGDAKEHLLAFTAEPYFPISPVLVKIAINGQTAGELELASGWHAYKLKLGAGLIKNADNSLTLSYSKTARPSDVEPNSVDTRELSVRFAQIQIQPILDRVGLVFDSRNALTSALMLEGWAKDPKDRAPGVWTVGNRARLSLPLTRLEAVSYRIALTARAMAAIPAQVVSLQLNQRPIGELEFSGRKATHEIELPEGALQEENELVLEFAKVSSPAEIDPKSTDTRLLGLRVLKLEILSPPVASNTK